MRENIIQTGSKATDGRRYIEYDWFENGIPSNVIPAEHVYIDSSYGFAGFHSDLEEGMKIGKGSGIYDRASFMVGKEGCIEVGEYTILNGCNFICSQNIKVGNHCMFAWGAVITDSWVHGVDFSIDERRKVLEAVIKTKERMLPLTITPAPVIIEDNVWVGFDAVVLPGVKLGRGCIVGSKSVVTKDVPAYAVVAGNPARVLRYLEPDDTEEVKRTTLKEHNIPG